MHDTRTLFDGRPTDRLRPTNYRGSTVLHSPTTDSAFLHTQLMFFGICIAKRAVEMSTEFSLTHPFLHLLPQNVDVVGDRPPFITDYCTGRKVLHVGCVDSGLTIPESQLLTLAKDETKSCEKQEKKPTRKPFRIAFFAGDAANFHFLTQIITHFRDLGCQLRVVKDLRSSSELFNHMQWSHVSWFDWGNGPIVPGSHMAKVCKIVCRIHRYEVFSSIPRRINWENVDDLIFVAEHVLNLFKEFHHSKIEQITKVHIIPNAVDLRLFRYRPRKKGFNIACITRFHVDKNPILIPHIVKKLVEKDSQFRCFIVGRIQDMALFKYFLHIVQQLNLEKHIIYEGTVADINSWLEDKHFLLCTSLIEGHPVAVLEAMAKGIKPVIHNYYGNPHKYFLREVIFNSIDEAVQIFLSDDYDSAKYRSFVEQRYDLKKQLQLIEQIVLQGPSKSRVKFKAKPLVSIVVPTFNRSRYLREALKSVLTQKFDDYEIIVVDDGSNDDTYKVTQEITDEFGATNKLRYIKKSHTGAPHTRNVGLEHASGEWILWLDDDDILVSDVLEKYVHMMSEIKDAQVFFGDLIVLRDSKPYGKWIYCDFYERPEGLLNMLLFGDCVPNPGAFVNKAVYERHGMFNVAFKRAHDYEYWSRIANDIRFKHIDEFVVYYRIHDGNLSIRTDETTVDTSYEIKILKSILQQYNFQELFKWLNWNNYRESLSEAYFLIAALFLTYGDSVEAKSWLEKSIEVGMHEKALALRAFLQKNEITQCCPVVKQEIERARKEIVIHFGYDSTLVTRGEKFFRNGNPMEALKLFYHVLNINPLNAMAHSNLACVLTEEDRLEEALLHIQKAYELEKNHKDILWNYVQILSRVGMKEKARKIWTDFLCTNPTNETITDVIKKLEVLR